MILLSRLNGKPIVVNAELIRSIEENPDTTLMMINGDHILVTEPMQEVVEKVIDYGRKLRSAFPQV